MGIAIDSPTHRRVVLAPVNRGRLNSMTPATKQKSLSLHRHGQIPPMSRSVSFAARSDKSSTSPSSTAGLAATKLKLRLQLALYKLQQQKRQSPRRQFALNTSFTSTPRTGKNIPTKPKQKTKPKDNANANPSVNINLKTVTTPSLSSIAGDRKLRLFAIKSSSSHYNPQQSAPLVPSNVALPQPKGLSRSPLPSINKILKTPLKNSSRRFVERIHADDTTIDEDDENQTRVQYSSSPVRDNYTLGTPNSFSVARSLLQLGSGYYN
ncbi:predicted protein [Meyerozyma guilliermondii ATCC 6260]|uniref:Uncharacterized protein n=1 Tax=Meyerozyma guilliermondii (strain ATCC 6260 / CBS 566 / DSM 6381 / JCM 1539 / NBRC 10279 / NRRL Y-324) TaxID=294746 RepID=A5DN43_PICGU|nr:uncharacterized protein PGUG_04694 [Meyerozyma guilliermondii ATCC 6260]EDK40596.2 predicted protein [Meyerozyma guilliermondii ATCC 6260]